jgi:hypothetical protein
MTVWIGVVSCWPGIVVVVVGMDTVVIDVIDSRVEWVEGGSATSGYTSS